MRNFLKPDSKTIDNLGFTLIEIIAVLAILAILASVSVPRFVDLNATAAQKGLNSAISELNSREALIWARIKNSQPGWIDDEGLFSQIDTELGSYYHWSPHAEITGGILHFKGQMVKLKRLQSTDRAAGRWEISSKSL